MTTITRSVPYCRSRFQAVRRKTRPVRVGPVTIGGDAPLVVQSMTTTPTQDVEATTRQAIALAEAGCEVVRITAQNLKAARALGEIRKRFSAAGFGKVPLVADIHFLPQAAMEAALHVEKVRVNPGNYADKKRFQQREYSDDEYETELQRLYEAFSPIVLRCRELGRAMRIGTNHGSLSDRIMNRYGDSPLGMCESALEFLRIAESHGFHDIVLSMKASNPKVMIQAYRMMVSKMEAEDMHYPLHLGVTEAGDGDDARIKSAIGIGSLLQDGLGDTIRVSLTEDPVAEIPVARALAEKAEALFRETPARTEPDPVDPYHFIRRSVPETTLGENFRLGPMEPPLVFHSFPSPGDETELAGWRGSLENLQGLLGEARVEGLVLEVQPGQLDFLGSWRKMIGKHGEFPVWDLGVFRNPDARLREGTRAGDVWLLGPSSARAWTEWKALAAECGARLALATSPEDLARWTAEDLHTEHGLPLLTLVPEALAAEPETHAVGRYRQLAEVLLSLGTEAPLWIRCLPEGLILPRQEGFGDRLLEASMLAGSLLADGLGDVLSVETVPSARQAVTLAYNILQGARSRTTRTEYVACPSCGRTLFDLQSTTQRIREATGHLKGVTIAVMGCIVNGPGEMADADFGYVGGAPGKVNLYVGKECVRHHIPAEEAVDALIDLIKEHGKWRDPS